MIVDFLGFVSYLEGHHINLSMNSASNFRIRMVGIAGKFFHIKHYSIVDASF